MQTVECCGKQTPVRLERVRDKDLLKQYYRGRDVRRGFLFNTGEECAAYLQFIVDFYDSPDLPDFTFFLQGYPVKHSPYITWMVQNMRRDLDFVSLSNLYMGYNDTGEPNSSLGQLLPIYVNQWFNFTAQNVQVRMHCVCIVWRSGGRLTIAIGNILLWLVCSFKARNSCATACVLERAFEIGRRLGPALR